MLIQQQKSCYLLFSVLKCVVAAVIHRNQPTFSLGCSPQPFPIPSAVLSTPTAALGFGLSLPSPALRPGRLLYRCNLPVSSAQVHTAPGAGVTLALPCSVAVWLCALP